MSHPTLSRIGQLGRFLGLIAHLAKGILLVWFVFPHINATQRDAIITDWSQEMLGILNARLRLLGNVPPATVSSVLFAANHISWLDIIAINAFRRVRFVAKAEVRQWPFIGWLAARTGTTFLRRSRHYEVTRLARTVSHSLRKGHCIALFPEGTTTDGTSVLPFHSGLFESAITAEATVWPVGLRYLRPDGTADVGAAFIGEDSLIISMLRIVARPTTDIQLWFAPPLVATGSTRRELAQQAREPIAQWVEGYHDRADVSAILPNVMGDPIIPPLSTA
jgi:1-acyl-sn-glycerol-3-phosphate acyltransferase